MGIWQSILETYENNWHDLSWEKQRHFAYRAWLVSKEGKWREKFMETISQTKKSWFKLKNLNEKEQAEYGRQREFSTDSEKANDSLKQIAKTEFPELWFWEDYIVNCRYLRKINDAEHNWKISGNEVDCLKRLVGNERLLNLFPVWVVERTFDMFYLGGLDQRSKLEMVFKDKLSRMLAVEVYRNLGYFLTHVIIGESDYYVKQVATDLWAGEELEKRCKGVIKLGAVDLIAEMGVSLKLAGREKKVDYSEIEVEIKKMYNPVLGRLGRGMGNLDKAEHRNIMAVMALANWGGGDVE